MNIFVYGGHGCLSFNDKGKRIAVYVASLLVQV
jgi:hypothetical protein